MRVLMALLFGAFLSLGAASPTPEDPARYPEFSITHTQSHRSEGVAFDSKVRVGYRLSSQWEWRGFGPELLALLREQGLPPGKNPAKAWTGTYPVGGTPRALFGQRGSILGMQPGERLQFYAASRDGEARDHTGATATVKTVGDGLTTGVVRESNGAVTLDHDHERAGSIPPSASVGAELIRTPKGAVLWFSEDPVPGAGYTDFLGICSVGGSLSLSQTQWQGVFTFTLTNQELAAWDRISRSNQALLRDTQGTQATLNYRADLQMSQPRDEVEVSVEPSSGYEAWIPEADPKAPDKPGKQLNVKVRVHAKNASGKPRKATLFFSLPHVSKGKGICGNWPNPGQEGEGLRFRQEDFPDGSPVRVIDRTHAQTKEPVDQVSLRLGSYDFGAWGTLRVAAKDDQGQEVRVKVRGQDTPDLDIPQDENANRIADAWEKGKITSRDRFWDEEEIPGQDSKGDGITLYNEYRGLMVLKGRERVHQRLLPTRKELFVLDPGEAFPLSLWKDRTGIEVLCLDESLVDPAGNPDGAPLVDCNAEDRTEHPFFALRVKTIPGDLDPDPARGKDGNSQPVSTSNAAFPLMAYASSNKTLRSADYIKVFPDRARLMVDYYLQWLTLGLQSPESIPGQELRDPKNLFSVEEAAQALSLLSTPQAQSALMQRMLNVFFIHEVGHICGGLPDHLGSPPKDYKAEARACFMWNLSRWDQRRMIVFSALGRGDSNFAYAYGNFCRDLPLADFHCYQSLRIKYW